MNKRRMSGRTGSGASVLILAILVSVVFLPVFTSISSAAPPIPFNRWGVGYDVAENPLANGTMIAAFIDGVKYGTNYTWTSEGLGKGSYNMDTIGDDPTSNNVKEGGDEGDPIMYVIGDMTTIGMGCVFRNRFICDSRIC